MSSELAEQKVVHFELRGGFAICGQFVDIEDGCRFQTGPFPGPKSGPLCPSKELEIKTIVIDQVGVKIQGQMMDFRGQKIIIPSEKGKVYLDHVNVHFSNPVPFGDHIVTIVELNNDGKTPGRLLLPSIATRNPIGQNYRVGGEIEFGTWMEIEGHKIWFPDNLNYL